MTVGNKVTAYKYNKNDELLRTDTLNTDTERDSVVLYKYDKNGNQLATVNRYEIPSDKKDSTYIDIDVTLGDNRLNENVVNHYNAENQLIQTLTKNYKVSFTYDAEGLRTSKTVNGKKTTFVWDGDQIVMELDASGKVEKRYVRGNDLIFADKGNNTEKQYYVTDPHGNVVQMTDEKGAVIKTYEYDSFGNEVKLDSKDENPFRYCGEYYDKETEEIYLRARYYEPEVGRFLTRDTYTGEEDEPESLHLYAYCGNDGVNYADPSGHWKGPIHRKITLDAVSALKKRIKKKFNKKYKLAVIKEYCTFPDKVQSGKVNPTTILGFEIKGGFEPGAKWHGRKRSFLNTLKKKARKQKLNKKLGNLTKKQAKIKKSRLLGCVLHSIEDWYAHSYILGTYDYKKKFAKYNTNSKEAIFHIDWIRIKNKNGKKIIKNDKEKYPKLDNQTKHSYYKDNPKQDFNISAKKWVSSRYKSNKRIKKAITECKKYIEGVIK